MSDVIIPEENLSSDVLEPKAQPVEETVEKTEAPAEAAAAEPEAAAAEPAEAPVAAEPAADASNAAAEEASEAPAAETVNYAEKTLSELVELFQKLGEGIERAKHSKEAEAIKSAFYKKLSREKFEAGLGAQVDEPGEEDAPEAETAQTETPEAEGESRVNPFEAIEAGFKSLYNDYKKERAELNRQQESERENNYTLKLAVIEDLKALVEKQEDVSATFPAFREIQDRKSVV